MGLDLLTTRIDDHDERCTALEQDLDVLLWVSERDDLDRNAGSRWLIVILAHQPPAIFIREVPDVRDDETNMVAREPQPESPGDPNLATATRPLAQSRR
jgi:hypothetical protein